jgi:pyruvate kinase
MKKKMLIKLMKNGMDAARINFSHGTYEQHEARLAVFKKARDKTGMPIPLILDTKGPEIRIKKFKDGKITLKDNQEFTLVCKDVEGDESKVALTYTELYRDMVRGNIILIDDGLIELKVESIQGKNINCRVINGGPLSNNKSLNLPDCEVNLPALTERDISDIKFGIEHGFDYIAASFIRKAADVLEIKKVLRENGGQDIKVISKIENREGYKNIDEIISASDSIMVARGDLGVEMPVEEVPLVQKEIINKCYKSGRSVITATQMLDSMIRNPRPTRAETSDVANAIHDGTSAIMLSGETAAGKYPIESLRTMAKIAVTTEESIDYWNTFSNEKYVSLTRVTNAISHATCTTAMDLKASAIITVTKSGSTARMVSRFRPACKIIAPTTDERAYRQLSLNWGIVPFLVETVDTAEEMFSIAIDKAIESGHVICGEIVVITGGFPLGISGTTNTLKVEIAGNVLAQGSGLGKLNVTGELCVGKTLEDLKKTFKDGDIIVTESTNNDMMPLIKRAKAIIVEEPGRQIHTAIVGLALDKTVITGATNATNTLRSGSVVTVDPDKGIVYFGALK